MFDVTAILGFLSRGVGSALSAVAPRFLRAWKRLVFPSASSHRFSVLVARFSGDSAVNTTQRTILDAIGQALPEVSVHAWSWELQFPDGEDRASQAKAHKTARKWLAQKRCDLLIAGRLKSSTVIQLRFITSTATTPGADDIVRPVGYVLPTETMDLPVRFISDLAAALGARIAREVSATGISYDFMNRLEVLSGKLNALIDASSDVSDPQTKAAVITSYASVRSMMFEFSGRSSDIEASLNGFNQACAILDPEKQHVEWARTRHNYGAALASLGSASNDANRLREAIDIIKETLTAADFTVSYWSKAQAILAFAYMELARITGSISALTSSLEVCTQVINQDVLDEEPQVWASVNDLYGQALLMLSDTQTDCEALHRAVQAFTDALEIWETNPVMKMSTTVNLTRVLIGLGIRHGNSGYLSDAIAKLEEIRRTVSKKDYARISQAVEINLGLCRASLAENEPHELPGAIAALRQVRLARASAADKRLSLRLDLTLAKALMLNGRLNTNVAHIEESIQLLEGMANDNEPTLQRDAKHALAVAHRLLGTLTGDRTHLDISRDQLSTLANSVSRAEQTFAFVQIKQSLGDTLKEIGKLTRSALALEQAITIFKAGLDFTTKEAPFLWAAIHVRLADAYFELQRQCPETQSLDRADEHIAEALSVLAPPAYGPLSDEALELAKRIHELAEERSH